VICVTLGAPTGANVEPSAAVLPGPERRRGSADTTSESLRLLVVDDDPQYGAYIAVLTRRLGFTTEIAADGAAALEELARAHYDVAIIDYEMPRMSGVELIANVRADRALKSFYAVMLTAREDMATKLDALNAGFDDFLTKASSELEIAAKLVAARRIAARQRTLDVTIRELYGLATRDELTGVFNRRFLLSDVERQLAAGTSLSVILFDLDDFKNINDTFGHLAGDRVLRDVGALFDRNTRPQDLIARYGGDEFVMVIAEVQQDELERIAGRLADEVQSLRWIAGAESFAISATTGIASSHLLADATISQLLNVADRDLYKNKWLRQHPEVKNEPHAPAKERTWRLDSQQRRTE
jgi:two-component system cell cycle response regulator